MAFLIAVYGFGFLQRSTADYRGGTGERERVLADPNYRIAAYDDFYNQNAGHRRER